MEKNLRLPNQCALLSEEEMTYTEGGATLDTLSMLATGIGVCVMGASYIWGIGQAKEWLKVNGKGNPFTVLGKATDALVADMSKSFANAARDVVATATVVGLWPLSLVLVILG